MKIDYVSDLHLNHHVRFIPNQEKWEKRTREWAKRLMDSKEANVLVIAGDFSEWNRQAIWFLEEAGKAYEQVFFVTGNHDYYLLSKSQRRIYGDSKGRHLNLIENARKIPNVQPLCREVINYKGKVIAGDSLWYRPVSPEDWFFFIQISNDSHYIIHSQASTMKEGVIHLYQEAMDWYHTLNGQHIDLMVSHIPPLHPPISPYPRNACYDCPVPFLVSENWICGHQHIQGDFQKNGTHFWMNAIGYPDEKKECKIRSMDI